MLRSGAFSLKGIAVGDDLAVVQPNDARGVFLSKLGIVSHHDDQTVLCDFLKQIHDLHARLAVKSARRLVGEEYFRVVHQSSRDRNALHLSARKLRGLFVDMLSQAHLFKRFLCAACPFLFRNASDGQRQLHVIENSLMGDEVVALEYEADRMVAVGVPVASLILFRGNSVYDQVARVIVIQSADHVEQRSLAGAARTEDSYEFIISQIEREVV